MMPGKGLRLGAIHGIEIRLDVSLGIIFLLVIYSLGAGLFPQWHPGWSVTLSWLTAAAAGVLFFSSLLAHELAHSLVAQRHGIEVPRITLFVFGGVSQLESEPEAPGDEFRIAIVGPLTSLGIGVACSIAGAALAGPDFLDDLRTDTAGALAGLGPGATLLLWLGPVNTMLGVFNLVPGFPLDGGRVLRAALWWLTGDLRKATEWASRGGRAFAWALMGLGVWEALSGAIVEGLWLALIGWFLNNAARSSYMQLLLTQAVESLVIGDLMRTRFESVQESAPLQEFIDRKLLRSDQIVWPVLSGDRALGLIGLESVREALRSSEPAATVGQAMVPIHDPVTPKMRGREALKLLMGTRRDPIPVMEAGHIVGLLFHADLMRWLTLHEIETRHGYQA